MTTRVRVVYMFDKHVHAFNLLIISMIMSDFMWCVRVWRLILKKSCSHSPLPLVLYLSIMTILTILTFLQSIGRICVCILN